MCLCSMTLERFDLSYAIFLRDSVQPLHAITFDLSIDIFIRTILRFVLSFHTERKFYKQEIFNNVIRYTTV